MAIIDTFYRDPQGFKCSRGHVFIAGKNMSTGEVDSHVVSWSDPATGSWIPEAPPTSNESGWVLLPYGLSLNPAIVERSGSVIIGDRYQFAYEGQPFVWRVLVLDE